MKTPRRTFLQSCALAGAGLVLASQRTAAEDFAAPRRTDDLWQVLKNRRSVRQFRPDPVPEADLRRILEAARSAPTSGNQQPWKFLVVREPSTISAMHEACVQHRAGPKAMDMMAAEADQQREAEVRKRLAGYFSAPVYIVVLTDNSSQYPDYNHWDGPLAAGYLMLAARALGYGTVFITDAIPEAITRQVLNIPERYTRVCITPLGLPLAWPDSPPKRPLDELVAWEKL
ncbi:MAG TPA: nitroreductase family protein [Opitutaceae bacterium]|nr:nitroreductase family protein [Opitutaceae bacterium]